MKVEREERDQKEKNALTLLSDVKKKWSDREDAKIQQLRSDLADANIVVQVIDLDRPLFFKGSCFDKTVIGTNRYL